MIKYQVMPDLSAEEYEQLKEDIAERGVQVPVEYDENGDVLDGHHRVRACAELGIKEWPSVVRVGLTEEQKRAHARKLNLARRHLTQEQKRELIRAQLVETPQVSDRQIGTSLGVAHTTVGRIRTDMEEGGELVQCTSSIGADGKERPRQVERKPSFVMASSPKEVARVAEAVKTVGESLPSGMLTVNDVKREERRAKAAVMDTPERVVTEIPGQILHGEMFAMIDKVPDSSQDLIIVDPPYGILDEAWEPERKASVVREFTERWLEKVIPKLKPTGRMFVFYSQEFMFDFPIKAVPLNYKGVLIWHYDNNNKPSDRTRYRQAFEPVFHFAGAEAGPLIFGAETYGETQSNVWTIATPQSNFHEGKVHPAQKPEEAIRRLIVTASREGDSVLDPFAGALTTHLVAAKYGRVPTSIEREADYIEAGKRRFGK